MTDAGLATYGAKNHYNRVRPFVHFNEGTCNPDDEALLRKDGSYPSGHTSIGWAWALVLTEIAPERRDALARPRPRVRRKPARVQRALAERRARRPRRRRRCSRAAAFQRGRSSPISSAARREIEALRQKGEKPSGNCTGEAEALTIKIPGVL